MKLSADSLNLAVYFVMFQIFYLPMAFFIPAPLFVAHIQLNMLYQFWIHTAVTASVQYSFCN